MKKILTVALSVIAIFIIFYVVFKPERAMHKYLKIKKLATTGRQLNITNKQVQKVINKILL